MDAKSQFLGTKETPDNFLTRSLAAIGQDTRGGASAAFAQEVQFIQENSPNPERAGAWAKKVLDTDKPKPPQSTVRRGMSTGM